jgi:NAD(P)-dependent dehydrogenase (short-subunit alcohol dehydrogenase family)
MKRVATEIAETEPRIDVLINNALTGHHRKTIADCYGEFPIEALYRELTKIPPVEIL